jgi:hypothetical protein
MKIITRNMPEYTGTWNWETKSQGLLYGGSDSAAVEKYRSDAEARIPRFNDIIADLQEKLGFDIKIIEPSTKTQESSLRKVWDRNAKQAYGNPGNITDYLRATIIVPEGPNGVNNLRRLLDALITHPDVIAYKDKFWKPEEETGHRSFNALINIDGHTAELKVDYEGMQDANDMTKLLRNYERNLKQAELTAPIRCGDKTDTYGKGLRKLTTKMEGMISTIRDLRLQCHDYHAAKCGLDELLDPNTNREKSLTTDFAKSVRIALSTNPLGRGLNALLIKLTPESEARPLRPN